MVEAAGCANPQGKVAVRVCGATMAAQESRRSGPGRSGWNRAIFHLKFRRRLRDANSRMEQRWWFIYPERWMSTHRVPVLAGCPDIVPADWSTVNTCPRGYQCFPDISCPKWNRSTSMKTDRATIRDGVSRKERKAVAVACRDVDMCMCMCARACMCVRACVCLCACMHMRVCACLCVHACAFVRVCVKEIQYSLHLRVCVCACACVCTYAFVRVRVRVLYVCACLSVRV